MKPYSTLGRRDFLKLSGGAAAVFRTRGTAWEARPANPGSVRPISIDMHTHWTPEAYIKAQVEMGRPAPAKSQSLDFDLDKRRKWMDEHGIQMHVLTLSGVCPGSGPRRSRRHASRKSSMMPRLKRTRPSGPFCRGIATPVKDPVMALKEVNRVAASRACGRCICRIPWSSAITYSNLPSSRSSRDVRNWLSASVPPARWRGELLQ